MRIHVEFQGGTYIKDAIEEAKQKAELLQVEYICFEHNGYKFRIGPGADVYTILEKYYAEENKFGQNATPEDAINYKIKDNEKDEKVG